MTDRDFRRQPKLSDFVAGHGGPAAIEYRGGAVKVIAAIVYGDGVVIEWMVGPLPDLSWMPNEEPSPERQTYLDKFKDQPEMVERLRRSRKFSNFWQGATLADDLGTAYQDAWGDSTSRDESDHRGRNAFTPAPPEDAVELTFRVHDLAFAIALERAKG
jgi:hypothetical protein